MMVKSEHDLTRTGPGTIAGRYLRTFWQPVYRSEDLPAGRAQTITIMSEQFTLYRGTDGRAAVVAPRCAHRGTLLSVGTVEDDCIRCLFHGWKYAPDGSCVEAPGESSGLASKVSVEAYPTREVFGLIFAYLGEGDAPEFPDLVGFSRARGYDVEAAPLVQADVYRRKCNYFHDIENVLDLRHATFTHRLSSNPNRGDGYTFDPSVLELCEFDVERTPYGLRTRQLKDNPDTDCCVVMPNAMHLAVVLREGTQEHFGWRVPINDEEHVNFLIMALPLTDEQVQAYRGSKERRDQQHAMLQSAEECADAVLGGERTLADFADHPWLTIIEDHVTQIGQGVFADREHERLGRGDKGVIQLRRLWQEDLSAFASGDQPVEWKWTCEPGGGLRSRSGVSTDDAAS
jgi:5,5'-dehydrodivanillate O-demethylase